MLDDTEITGTLEDWYVEKGVTRDGSESMCLWGRCFGDVRGRFRDGEIISTSLVKIPEGFTTDTFDPKEGDVVNTLYSRYKLGAKRLMGPVDLHVENVAYKAADVLQ